MIPAIVAAEFLESRFLIWLYRTHSVLEKAEHFEQNEAAYRKAAISVYVEKEEIYFILLTRALFKKLNDLLPDGAFDNESINRITTSAIRNDRFLSTNADVYSRTTAFFDALVRATITEPAATISKFAASLALAPELSSNHILLDYLTSMKERDPFFIGSLTKPITQTGLPYSYTVDFLDEYINQFVMGLQSHRIESVRSNSAQKGGYVADQWFAAILAALTTLRALDISLPTPQKGMISISSLALPLWTPNLSPRYSPPILSPYSLTRTEVINMDSRIAIAKGIIPEPKDKK